MDPGLVMVISQLTVGKPAHSWESGLSSTWVESTLGVMFITSFRFMELPQTQTHRLTCLMNTSFIFITQRSSTSVLKKKFKTCNT